MSTDSKAQLLPCPFCGCKAHFEIDDDRWEWIECESCGMQGNRSASLMEDCKPKLAEAWNSRAQPAQVPEGWKLVPVEPTDEMLAATSWPGCAKTDYGYMIAAAPQPPDGLMRENHATKQGEE